MYISCKQSEDANLKTLVLDTLNLHLFESVKGPSRSKCFYNEGTIDH